MIFAKELHMPIVHVSSQAQGLFNPSELLIRTREIVLHAEDVFF